MGRWEPDARGRLAEAALDLYNERGFEQTTVAEIAKRARLNERTFFRHFADKREVLFAGAEELQTQLVRKLEGAPETLPAIDAVRTALETLAELLPARNEFSRRRQAIIAANPELQERERVKLASLAAAIAGALRRRGVKGPTADLLGELGIAVFRIAFERWIAASGRRGLAYYIRASFDDLKTVSAGT